MLKIIKVNAAMTQETAVFRVAPPTVRRVVRTSAAQTNTTALIKILCA